MPISYVSGRYTSYERRQSVIEVERWITNEFDTRGPITDTTQQRDMNWRLMEVTDGKNIVRFDDQGNPSIMVVVPFKRKSELGLTGDAPHDAFIVNGNAKSKIEIAKYPCITVGSGTTERAVSLRFKDPRTWIPFDQAVTVCKQKGAGWHLMTNAEWALIALLTKANGFMPRGNTSFGKSSDKTSEWGEVSYRLTWSNGRTSTGSGPATWSHDGTDMGIYDLTGNVWEWVGGYRTVDGEIQIIPNNDAADAGNSQASDSTKWKAILQDGSLVDPGTANTLKWDYTADPGTASGPKSFRLNTVLSYQQTVEAPSGEYDFASLAAAAGVTVPEILKALALFPADTGDHGSDHISMRNIGERLAFRGGAWDNWSAAGVFALAGDNPRSFAYAGIGFRSAFVS